VYVASFAGFGGTEPMREASQRLAHNIDGRTLRQRAIIFLSGVGILIFLLSFGVLRPHFVKQKAASQQIARQSVEIATMRGLLDKKIAESKLDPDTVERARLAELKEATGRMRSSVLDKQRDLVPPEKMA